MTYEEIDINNWKRAMHFMLYQKAAKATFGITVELDVTNFLYTIHKRHCSFTMAMIYAVHKCANEIEEFRYRFLNNKVVLYDYIGMTSFAYMNRETELFKNVYAPMKDTSEEFCANALKLAKEQKNYFTGPQPIDCFQYSSMPWATYLSISHTISGKADIPIFEWGKYHEKYGRIMMPFSIQANHGFVDGIHLCKLVDKLQVSLDNEGYSQFFY